MNDNDRKDPGEAAGDGKAAHGYRNEVSWEEGKGRQPYTNQGDEELGPASAREYEGGNAGDAAGRNLEQLDAVRGKPEVPAGEAPRETWDSEDQHQQDDDGDRDAEKPEDDGHVELLSVGLPPR